MDTVNINSARKSSSYLALFDMHIVFTSALPFHMLGATNLARRPSATKHVRAGAGNNCQVPGKLYTNTHTSVSLRERKPRRCQTSESMARPPNVIRVLLRFSPPSCMAVARCEWVRWKVVSLLKFVDSVVDGGDNQKEDISPSPRDRRQGVLLLCVCSVCVDAELRRCTIADANVYLFKLEIYIYTYTRRNDSMYLIFVWAGRCRQPSVYVLARAGAKWVVSVCLWMSSFQGITCFVCSWNGWLLSCGHCHGILHHGTIYTLAHTNKQCRFSAIQMEMGHPLNGSVVKFFLGSFVERFTRNMGTALHSAVGEPRH